MRYGACLVQLCRGSENRTGGGSRRALYDRHGLYPWHSLGLDGGSGMVLLVVDNTFGVDTSKSTNFENTIVGQTNTSGNDLVVGMNTNDPICGGRGNDVASEGDVVLPGDDGIDGHFCGNRAALINGGNGIDILGDGACDNVVNGGADTLDGSDGNEQQLGDMITDDAVGVIIARDADDQV